MDLKNITQTEVIPSTEVQPSSTTSEAVTNQPLDISALVEEAVKKALEQQLKTLKPMETVGNTKQDTPHTEQVKTQELSFDIESKFNELERKMEEKYEKKMFFESLTQSQLSFLKEIEDYEKYPIKSLRKIVSGISGLPPVNSTPQQAPLSTLESIVNKLRPNK